MTQEEQRDTEKRRDCPPKKLIITLCSKTSRLFERMNSWGPHQRFGASLSRRQIFWQHVSHWVSELILLIGHSCAENKQCAAHQNVIVGTSFAEQYSSGSIVVGECWLLRARGEVWEAVGVLTERTKKRSVKPRVNFKLDLRKSRKFQLQEQIPRGETPQILFWHSSWTLRSFRRDRFFDYPFYLSPAERRALILSGFTQIERRWTTGTDS